MNQGEQIMGAIGSGVAIIRERSNRPEKQIPYLVLMLPGELGCVINGGCSDQATYDRPAQSFELQYESVKQLYELLKTYFSNHPF